MKQLLATVLICLCSSAFAQLRMPATTRHDLAQMQALAAEEPGTPRLIELTRGRYPVALLDGRCMVGFLGRAIGEGPTSDEHVTIGARIGDIVSFRVDMQHLDRVGSLTGLSYVELAGILRPSLDKVVRATRADSVQQGINLPQTYTGRNVIIGIVDFGLEYAHPMFYDTALVTTRILAAWDQYKLSGPAPSAFGYGTEYNTSSEVLAAGTDTLENGFRDTHGTHVAGIAGGGGAGTPYRGIAFDANFLFASILVDGASALDALLWMHDRALQEQKRLVVNMSWGQILDDTDTDGSSIFAQALNLLSDQGVMLVASNGNFGGYHFHVQSAFNVDTMRTRIGFAYLGMDVGQRIMLWGEAGLALSATLTVRNTSNAILAELPWSTTNIALPYTDTLLVIGVDTVHVSVLAEAAHPITGRPYMRYDASKTSSTLRVDLNIAATTGTVHAWNALWTDNSFDWYALGFQAGMPGYIVGNDEYGVREPATANSVLAVGAYSSEYQTGGGTWVGGGLAAFSSKGPTLDGRLKPEISAPGVNVMSSINGANTVGWPTQETVLFQGDMYAFSRGSGTSMAAPAVTGIAALLLEAMPFATPAEIKQAIMDNARTDNFTGVIAPQGSTTWGMGKVNAYRTVVDMLGVVGIDEHDEDGIRLWPNPASDVLFVHVENAAGPLHCEVLDVTGRRMEQQFSTSGQLRIDTHSWNAGAYILRVSDGRNTIVRRVVHY
ncbi:MAG: S8 family peptidase [Flavobacteriales bacterium]